VPIHHIVRPGESAVSLAERYGLFAQTIWDEPENAGLRAIRSDMNTLMPGDELFIPDLRRKTEAVATDQKHSFRRKGIPAHFRIQLYDFGEPRANQDYTLVIHGVTITGRSDGDGVVEAQLPAGAQAGLLTIGEDRLMVELAFGHLNPLSEISGVQQRLANLGYDPGPADGELGPRSAAALRAFQIAQDRHLQVTGELDEPTRERLGALHDAKADDTLGKAVARS
jgi:hypothetical protein